MLVVLLVLFVVLAVKQINIHPQLGVDEIYYLDYALKSPSLGIRIGEQVGTEAMTTAGCRGIEVWPEELIPDCGDPQPDPNQLWQQGYNVSFQHPPIYFSVTSIGGKVMSWLPGVQNKLTAFRLMGAVWLVAGMSLLWYALGLRGLDTVSKAALVALLGAPPVVVYTAASVHAGNTQLVGGAVLLVSLMLWESGRWRWWAVPAAAGLAVWLNFNNASAVGALVAYLAYKAWRNRDQRHDLVVTAATSFIVSVGSVIGWQLWQNHRKLADVEDLPVHQVTLGESGFHWQQVDDELRAVFTPFRNQWIQTWDVLTSLSGIADIGLIFMMGATLAVTAHRSTHRYFTAGVATAMVGFGVVTMLSTYAAGYSYFQLTPARYGLALLPFAAVAIAPAIRQIALARLGVIALAAVTCAAIAYGVFTAATSTQDVDMTEAIRRAHQEQQIDSQQQLIGEQHQQIDSQERLRGEQEQQIDSQQQLIGEQEQQIDSQQQLIGEQGQLIDDQEQLIGKKESLLNEFRCQVVTEGDHVPGGCDEE